MYAQRKKERSTRTSSMERCLFEVMDTVWGHDLISLPVNDDRIRGRLVPIAAALLLTTATEWAIRGAEKENKSV